MRGDDLELLRHGAPCLGIEVIELRDVAPGRKEGIAAAGDDGVTDNAKITRCRAPVVLGPLDVSRRMLARPGVIEGRMVRNEVEEQGQAASVQLAPSHVQRRPAAHPPIGLVGLDAIGRAGHVSRAPSRQHAIVVTA